MTDLEKADTDAKAMAATAAVTALIDGAVAAGRITASQKPHFVTFATADLGAAKAALEGMPPRGSLVTTITAHVDGTQLAPLTAGGAMLEVQARLAGN